MSRLEKVTNMTIILACVLQAAETMAIDKAGGGADLVSRIRAGDQKAEFEEMTLTGF